MTSSPPPRADSATTSSAVGGAVGSAAGALVCVVLAGGRSTRMGQDKAALQVAPDCTALQHVVQCATLLRAPVIVVAPDAARLPALPPELACEHAQDPGDGPVAALWAALNAAALRDAPGTTLVATLSVDLPALCPEHLEALRLRLLDTDADAALVVDADGTQHPLCSILTLTQLRRSAASDAARHGPRTPSLRALYADARPVRVTAATLPEPTITAACNTPAQWAAALQARGAASRAVSGAPRE